MKISDFEEKRLEFKYEFLNLDNNISGIQISTFRFN